MLHASGPRSHDYFERLKRLLRDEKTWIGLSNSLGGLVVFVLYLVVQP